MLSLRPLTAADLPRLEPWFNDADTRHWLGDRRWPANKLGMGGPSHHALLALVDDIPAALADVDISDDRRAAFAIVVAPEQRRRGVGRAVTSALLKLPQFAEVCEWFAGVETGNIASRQLLEFLRLCSHDGRGRRGLLVLFAPHEWVAAPAVAAVLVRAAGTVPAWDFEGRLEP